MKIVIITRPDFFDGETALVNRLFRLGMQRLHLRKPKATEEEMSRWIDEIDAEFHHLIVLHDHHSLARQYHLGGVHLNSRNPDIPSWAKGENVTVSRSCHSLEEILRYKDECDYLFLSPIYDSISKEGYGAAFSQDKILSAHQQGIIDQKVLALGGISCEHLHDVASMGFGGAVILGDLWLSPSPQDRILEYYQESTRVP